MLARRSFSEGGVNGYVIREMWIGKLAPSFMSSSPLSTLSTLLTFQLLVNSLTNYCNFRLPSA